MTVHRTLKFRLLIITLMLALASLACNAPLGEPQAAPTDVFDFITLTAQAGQITPAYTETPNLGQPTATLPPGITPSPTVCDFWMVFVTDVTIPDGTVMQPGQQFDKTWRIRNNGCETWPAGTQLVFYSGEQMGGVDTAIPDLPVENEELVDVTVKMTAPAAAGTYVGYWTMNAPNKGDFGPQVYVEIIVQAGPTPTPTVSTSTPAFNAFLGTWINVNPATTNITKIELDEVSQVIFIHMWNKGVPGDIDRGEANTAANDASDGVLNFTWTEDDFVETQQVSILANGNLLVYGTINYTDPARTDITYTENFAK